MRIAEIFRSIQGEGRLTGVESVFVRASGCNLRCRWCDTPYASWAPEGEDLAVAEVIARVEELEQDEPACELQVDVLACADSKSSVCDSQTAVCKRRQGVSHVVLTGGEPMLFGEVIPLAAELRRLGRHVTIETSGTLYLPVECDLMSISPKLSNSTPSPDRDARWAWRHELARHAPGVIRRLITEYDYQLKFVIDRPEDCREVQRYLAELSEVDRNRVMLMPQGTATNELAEKAAWLRPYCAGHGLAFCPRRHIEWFGQVRGK